MGFLLIIAADLVYERRAVSESDRMHKSGWNLFTEPSEFEEGALWAGAFSIAFGCGLLIRDLARTGRRQSQ